MVEEEGKEEIVDCLVDNWLISWGEGERFLRRAAILAAKTATFQDNPAKGQAGSSHDLRLFADSTPILKFYCRPMDISSANVLGNLERAETDVSDGRLRFQRLVFSSQETAGCRQIFDDRSIHGSLLVGLAFQARNYGIETTFFILCEREGIVENRNWYPYFLKNLAFFSYVCVCVCTICNIKRHCLVTPSLLVK